MGEIKYLNDLNLAKGVHRGMDFLVKNQNDLNDFMEKFWIDRNNQVTSWSNYRQFKLQQRDMQLDEFLNLYQSNPIKALENLFMQIVYLSDVNELEKEMVAERLTLERLYHLHKDKPEQRMKYFMRRSRYNGRNNPAVD